MATITQAELDRIDTDELSIIIVGPQGSGKTTLARLIDMLLQGRGVEVPIVSSQVEVEGVFFVETGLSVGEIKYCV